MVTYTSFVFHLFQYTNNKHSKQHPNTKEVNKSMLVYVGSSLYIYQKSTILSNVLPSDFRMQHKIPSTYIITSNIYLIK